MITIRTLTILFGCLALSGVAWADGGCSCNNGVAVEFWMEEDIEGEFSVTLNDVTVMHIGTDTKVPSRTGSGKVKLEVDKEYEVTANVGTDMDEANDKGDDRANIFFVTKGTCGYVFEVYSVPPHSGAPNNDDWKETKTATVYSNEGNSVWGFGVGGEVPVNDQHKIKVRFRKTSDSGMAESSSSQSPPSVTNPGSDFPTGPSDQPDEITPFGFSHELGLGRAIRYTGEEGQRVSAGNFRLAGGVGSTSMASRSNLKYNGLNGGGIIVRPAVGVIEQVETGNLLAIAADEASGFSVKLYGAGSYQPSGSGGFEPISGATPFTTVLYEPVVATQLHTGGIRITTTTNGSSEVKEIVAPVSGGSSMRETIYDPQTSAALQVTERNSVFIPVAGDTKWQRIDVETVTRDGALYSKTEEDWTYEAWGEVITKRRVFIDSTTSEETTYTYYTDATKAYYGKQKNVIHPDGAWEESVYQDGIEMSFGYAPGQLLYRYQPWLDQSPFSPTQENSVRTEYSYVVDPNTYTGYFATLLGRTIKSISGIPVGQTENQYYGMMSSRSTSVNASQSLSSLEYHSLIPNWMNFPSHTVSPDNTATQFSYGKLQYDPVSGNYLSSPNGEYKESIQKNGYDNAGFVEFIAGQSTGTRTITDAMGRTVRESKLVYTGSGGGWTEVSVGTWLYEDLNGDEMPDKTSQVQNGQTMSIVQEISAFETHSWDQAGWQTITITDALGRTKSIRRVGQNGQADILTTYSYAGRTTTITVTGGAESLITSSSSDLLGRQISSTDENGHTTTYSYGFSSGSGRTTTTTRPDGKTEITTYYLDGQLKSVTGTGVVAKYYGYSVDAEGYITTTERTGSATSPRLTSTKQDWAGRTVEVTRPAFTGNWASTHTYNAKGQIYKVEETGLAPMLYVYDLLGEAVRTGRDVGPGGSPNGVLDENSEDTITETIMDFITESGEWLQRRTTKQWQTNQNAGATTIRVAKSVIASPYGDTRMLDVHSDLTTTTTSVTSGIFTTTTNVPFSDIDIVQQSAGGRVISQNSATVAASTLYGYDDLGRTISVTDPQGAVTTMTYYSGTNRQKMITPPAGPSSEYLYTPAGQNGAGQVSAVITRDRSSGAELSRLTYTYDARGNLASESGSGTYPVEHIYDPVYPEKTGLKTYRDAAGTADLTTWTFQASTGLMVRKEYADEKGTNYTYHASGLLSTRVWARNGTDSNPLTTYYTYDASGMPDAITYSEGSAPPIDYQYNRAGRMTQVTDAAGTRSFTHGSDGQIATESITGAGLLAGYTTTHSFGTAGHGLRDSVSIAHGLSTIVANSFGYESSTGRFLTAAQAGHTATYGYQPNTDWEASITHNSGSTTLFTKRTYRDLGSRVTGVVSRAGSTPAGQILSSAGYILDAKGRRQSLLREDGTRWDYGYNSRDEVESGAKRQGNGNLLAGRQFEYDYDDVGNRKTARFGGDGNGANLRTISYTPNSVNQYTSITHPGIEQLLGYSPDAGAITATPGQQGSTTRQGNFWRAEVSENNTTTGKWADVEALQDASGTPAIIGQGKLWIPPANAAPTYDDDGNLISDGRWDYQWNGENRLVKMTTSASALTGGHPWMRLSFQYDFMGRRIHKKVETGSSGSPVVNVNRLFLYDGWNMVGEIETASGTAKTLATYLWGLDVSGNEQGAGGVGGLLLCQQDTNGDGTTDAVFRPSYDGNGNIIAWIGGTGAVVARIDYDPFGRVITRQSSVSGLVYGFSTKYTDIESGLCYYGYRFYDPITGRWPSRDPIAERGGINLYGFIGNDGVNQWDVLGLQSTVFPIIWRDTNPPTIREDSEESICKCLDIKFFVLTKSAGIGVLNPANTGYIYNVPDDAKELPIASGHGQTLDPRIRVDWKDDDGCECKTGEDKEIIVYAQVDNKWKQHNLHYDYNKLHGWAPPEVPFSHQQLGIHDGSGVGKELRVVVEARRKFTCLDRTFKLVNVGGSDNNIPGFVKNPNTPWLFNQ